MRGGLPLASKSCAIRARRAGLSAFGMLRSPPPPAQPEVQKLAKALEEIRKRSAINRAMNPNPFELTALLGDIYQIADSEL